MQATLFTKVDYSLNLLIDNINMGEIGLPDIQRPFIWKPAKVRDLFDSMYKGFPVGYLLFWSNGLAGGHRQIGTDTKQKVPRLLIVDGQQRLTSLFAVLKSRPVMRSDYTEQYIQIAFRPKDAKFEVADAAIRRDPEYIANISDLWSGNVSRNRFVKNFIKSLRDYREVREDEEDFLIESIDRLYDLHNYPFTALELSSNVSVEQVADVFVRINSKGITLNQADFILTLMSVFWDEGRKQLEHFSYNARKPSLSEASPYNHFITPYPDQLLRVSVGYGFRRARLQYVYSILRGKDLETEKFSEELRVKQFEVLKKAQEQVLDLKNWHEFLNCLVRAGFRNTSMISSKNAVLYSYIMFLIGKCDYQIGHSELRALIARWFFVTSLTGRYSSSPETAMESDFGKLRFIEDKDGFEKTLDQIINDTFTEDFWSINLPNELSTSSPRSPSLFAYYASLNLLEANVLFSKMKVAELLDPALKAKKSAIERHHLFPKNYLKKQKITEIRDTNQIANYALVEWIENIKISDKSPEEYLPDYMTRFKDELEKMYYWHALPSGWEKMSYFDFLEARRKLIAKVIYDGYKRLSEEELSTIDDKLISVEEILSQGESDKVEFKSTLRFNLYTKQKDHRLENACLKTIAGFLNSKGGTLIIGIQDNGEPLGLDIDGFENEDRMNLHLVNLIKDKMGSQHMLFIRFRFETYREKRVLLVDCSPGQSPVYLKEQNVERFYIRSGASTNELLASQIHEYIKNRFGS